MIMSCEIRYLEAAEFAREVDLIARRDDGQWRTEDRHWETRDRGQKPPLLKELRNLS